LITCFLVKARRPLVRMAALSEEEYLMHIRPQRVLFVELYLQVAPIPYDEGQNIVEVLGEASRKLTHDLHFAQVAECPCPLAVSLPIDQAAYRSRLLSQNPAVCSS